jgi:hypothetical protein
MDADSQAASAERALQELQQALQAATLPKGAKQDDRMRQVEDLERRVLRVKNALDSYRLEMRALSAEEQSTHKERLRAIEEGLRHARQQIEWKRYDASTAAGDGGTARTALAEADPEQPMTLEQAVATADRIQDQSHASVKRSMGMALQAEQLGVATLQKMHEQEEQMDAIAEDMEDVKANIKRSKKLVAQIARSAMSDRCIQLLCVLITIAVMVMIVLAITNKDGGSLNVPNEVREVGQ